MLLGFEHSGPGRLDRRAPRLRQRAPEVVMAVGLRARRCRECDQSVSRLGYMWTGHGERFHRTLSTVADIDADGTPTRRGFVVYDWIRLHRGLKESGMGWISPVVDAMAGRLPGVADFDGDGQAEVAVRVLRSGVPVQPPRRLEGISDELAGGALGGPRHREFRRRPEPEIGVAGKTSYACSIRTAALCYDPVVPADSGPNVRAYGSAPSISTETEGRDRYKDETTLRIFDGATGVVLASKARLRPRLSRTRDRGRGRDARRSRRRHERLLRRHGAGAAHGIQVFENQVVGV